MAAILDHWDDLPDVIAFMHAHKDSWHTYLSGVHTNSEWRLLNLRWPRNEPYVDLSCREPTVDMGIFATETRGPGSGTDMRTAWMEHFRHYLGLKPPRQIVAPCCAQFLATKDAIQGLPREFYVDTLKWMDSSIVGDPSFVMEYVWQIMYSRRHSGLYPWAFLPNTCSCYLYGLACNNPDTLFHLNPVDPPKLPW